MLAPGGEDVPAAVRPTVHPAGGGAAAPRERRGGAIAGTGHTVEKGGNAVTHAQAHQNLSCTFVRFIYECFRLHYQNVFFTMGTKRVGVGEMSDGHIIYKQYQIFDLKHFLVFVLQISTWNAITDFSYLKWQ